MIAVDRSRCLSAVQLDSLESPTAPFLRPSRVAKRWQVVDAARRLFLADGYAATSMNAIAAEAGVSKQTVYAYFVGKRDLLAEVLVLETERGSLPEVAECPPETVDELRGRLLVLAQGVVALLEDPASIEVLRLTLGEASHIPELRAQIGQSLPSRLLVATTALIRDADQQGVLRAPRPELPARLFVGGVMSYVVIDGMLGREQKPGPAMADLVYVVDSVLAGMGVIR